MNGFSWNMLLALAWALLTGNFAVGNLILGFVFGYLVLAFANRHSDRFRAYTNKVPLVLRFAGFFVVDLVKANLRVAYDVLTPTHLMRPAVIGIPLELESDAAITLLANLITVTPGSLALDVSADRRVLYIHVMYMDNEETVRAELKKLERRVQELVS